MKSQMSKRGHAPAPSPVHLPLSSAEDVGAIAVDTNIYREYGFRVRSQPLLELPQVHALGAKWLVPEVWEKELFRHVRESTERVTSLRRDLAKVREWGSEMDVKLADQLVAAWASESAETVASRLLDEHFKAGQPRRLTTAWAAGPKVLENYFASKAPFEATGIKKSEFPDAFALVTLEDWAKKNGTKVLVVSKDQGCLRACEASEFLQGYASLPEALGTLRKADAGRRAVMEEYEQLIAHELTNEASDLRRGIDAVIRDRIPDLDPEIEFQEGSGLDCEHVLSYLSVDSVEPLKTATGMPVVRVFTATMGELNFACELVVGVDVEARFARAHPRGRSSFVEDAPPENASGSIEVEAIVTLQPSGALSARTLPHATVRRVELKVRDTDIDFGVVDAWVPSYED